MKNQQLNEMKEFESKNSNGEGGFFNRESAHEYSKMKLEWWGSNLISTGIEEKNGLFYPGFNVFD
jgi:hypothetical protein